MEYQNLVSVNLMIWEVNPRKRDNSTISFYENKDVKLVEGDSILGLRDKKTGNTSVYTINQIKERRQGALKSKNYVVCDVSFQFKNLN